MRGRRVGARTFLAGFVALVVASCASSGESSGERRNTSELLPEEIRAAPVSNLYEAVEQLRPRWLQIRSVRSLSGAGGQIGVFVNRTHVGGPEVLRSMSVDGVARLRYLDGPAASAQFRSAGGDGFPGGIIVETVDGR